MPPLTLENYFISEILNECFHRLSVLQTVFQFDCMNRNNKNTKHGISAAEIASDKETVFNVEISLIKGHNAALTPEEKLENDRSYAENIVLNICKEIQSSGTYKALTDSTEEYKQTKDSFLELQEKANKEHQRISDLKSKLLAVEKKLECDLNSMKDTYDKKVHELLVTKDRTAQEVIYTKSLTQNNIEQVKKLAKKTEADLKSKIMDIKNETVQQEFANEQMSNHWRQVYNELSETLHSWKLKYFNDDTLKEKELKSLKKYKALNIEKIAFASRQLQIYEDVIESDKKEKQLERERQKQKKLEDASGTKIQAWWRGVMVRRKLGPYVEKKPEPAKKGKKGKGKKGKKK